MANTQSIFKLIYVLKKLTDQWGDRHLQPILPDFKMSLMPVLISVGQGLTTNVAIANELHISKMAVSKMINGLTKLDLIKAIKDEKDGRSEKLSLTHQGEAFLNDVISISAELEIDYRKQTGDTEYDQIIENLHKLLAYHESQLH